MSRKRPVPRSIRALNLAALLLFLAGAGLYARAWVGMRWLRDEYVAPADAPQFAAMAEFNTFWNYSRVGAALVWGAVALAIIAAATLVFMRRDPAGDDAAADAPAVAATPPEPPPSAGD